MDHTEWVYVLTNPAMPNIVKIGMTTRTVETRAKELSNDTAVPKPFSIAFRVEVKKGFAGQVEKQVHRKLSKKRPNNGREFFEVSVAEAKQAIEEVCGQTGASYNPPLAHSSDNRKARHHKTCNPKKSIKKAAITSGHASKKEAGIDRQEAETKKPQANIRPASSKKKSRLSFWVWLISIYIIFKLTLIIVRHNS